MIPIFVVRFRNPKTEDRCIEAVRKYADPKFYPLVVLDNGILDESLAVVWNRMIDLYDWSGDPDPAFVLLNTDAFLEDDATLPIMERALRADPLHGFVGPMTDNAGSNQKIDSPKWTNQNADDLGVPGGRWHGAVIRDEYISGFCLMVRKLAWKQAGRFPEDGPFYGQESALIWKGMSIGWRTVMCLDTFVEHLGGATCKKYLNQDEERARGGEWFADFRARDYDRGKS